jgi:hypothetical protein
MAVYLVTWDLNKEKPNYAEARKQFIAHLERYENKKDSGLDSVRFVSTQLSADQLSDDLRKKLDDNDRIIVTKLISGNHQGWLGKDVWEWINARL